MIYMFLSNKPSSGDINSSNLSCFITNSVHPDKMSQYAHFIWVFAVCLGNLLGVSSIQRVKLFHLSH